MAGFGFILHHPGQLLLEVCKNVEDPDLSDLMIVMQAMGAAEYRNP